LLAKVQRGQRRIGEFMEVLELPWAPDESQPCSSHRNIPGLQHDCSQAHWGMMTFWPVHRLPDEVEDIIGVARQVCLCSGAAAKLYRVIDFLGNGMIRRMGHAGVNAVKQRHYEAWAEVTQSLAASFTSIQHLLALQPRYKGCLPAMSARFWWLQVPHTSVV